MAISLITVTTDFAATSGAIVAMLLSHFHTRKWDAGMAMNDCLGGLVAVTAPCAFVTQMVVDILPELAGAVAAPLRKLDVNTRAASSAYAMRIGLAVETYEKSDRP